MRPKATFQTIGPAALLLMLSMAFADPARGDDPVPASAPGAAEAFFETKIRPVLAENCWSCHGPDQQKSDLRLDSRAAGIEGGLEGPAIEPGDPDASLLIEAVRREGHLKMPPKTALSEAVVEDLTNWVRQGAPWPEGSQVADPKAEAAREHWAFQPIRDPQPPRVEGVANPIDAFIRSRLAEAEIVPSPEADRRTLIRRVTFDLTGLPPTPAEVQAFLGDESPDGYERLVDRLLASPRYGERWGRHWLDLARYADTKGYVFQEESRYPFAYTYRDYVIDAFNADLSYDRFVVEQIAADLIPEADRRPKSLAAMGFLTVGRRFLNNQEDLIDDRIDLVGRGLMGLTIACARCHDHKYDPIPTEDYYSLVGVFASSVEPVDLPLVGPAEGPEADDYRAKRAERESAVASYLADRRAAIGAELREHASAYLRAAQALDYDRGHPDFDARVRADGLRERTLRQFLGDWKERLDREDDHPIFRPLRAFGSLNADDFAAESSALVSRGEAGPLAGDSPPGSLAEVHERLADLIARAADPETPDDPAIDEVRALLDDPDGPFAIPADPERSRRLLDRAERDHLKELEREVAKIDANHPGAPARAMVMVDRPEPIEPHVAIRGNPARPGDAVPRQFPAIVSGPNRAAFEGVSGRLEMAEAIVDPLNPMTARVIVNRVWRQHYGRGLVETPSDFGLRSDPPSHPELLDFLASRLVEGGWSLKRLHRLILNSSTYRQASDPRPETETADPENRLLGRQNRRRLEFEPLRDSMLAVAGRLDERRGGRPVPIVEDPSTPRRTVYGFIDRGDLPGLLRAFDFASPDATSPGRSETVVPQQALFLLNSPFAAEQARGLADRLGSIPAVDREARVDRLYRLLYGREPSPSEREVASAFLDGSEEPGSKLDRWESYAQVLLMTNEFLYVD